MHRQSSPKMALHSGQDKVCCTVMRHRDDPPSFGEVIITSFFKIRSNAFQAPTKCGIIAFNKLSQKRKGYDSILSVALALLNWGK